MGAVVENLGKGGVKLKVVRDVIQGVGAGRTYFRVVDVGDDPLNEQDPGKVFSTSQTEVLLGGSPGECWMGFGSNHLWIRKYGRQGFRRCRHMY